MSLRVRLLVPAAALGSALASSAQTVPPRAASLPVRRSDVAASYAGLRFLPALPRVGARAAVALAARADDESGTRRRDPRRRRRRIAGGPGPRLRDERARRPAGAEEGAIGDRQKARSLDPAYPNIDRLIAEARQRLR